MLTSFKLLLLNLRLIRETSLKILRYGTAYLHFHHFVSLKTKNKLRIGVNYFCKNLEILLHTLIALCNT